MEGPRDEGKMSDTQFYIMKMDELNKMHSKNKQKTKKNPYAITIEKPKVEEKTDTVAVKAIKRVQLNKVKKDFQNHYA